jgi:hypothetical protein
MKKPQLIMIHEDKFVEATLGKYTGFPESASFHSSNYMHPSNPVEADYLKCVPVNLGWTEVMLTKGGMLTANQRSKEEFSTLCENVQKLHQAIGMKAEQAARIGKAPFYSWFSYASLQPQAPVDLDISESDMARMLVELVGDKSQSQDKPQHVRRLDMLDVHTYASLVKSFTERSSPVNIPGPEKWIVHAVGQLYYR